MKYNKKYKRVVRENDRENDIEKSDAGINILANGLLKVEELQAIQDAFSYANNVASIIKDPEGRFITKPSNCNRLCSEIIPVSKIHEPNCLLSNSTSVEVNFNGPIIQTCKSEIFWDGSASIIAGDQLIANWIIGHVRVDDVDEEKILAYIKNIKADKDEFLSALAEIPVMTKDQFTKVCVMLFHIANVFSNILLNKKKQEIEIGKRKIVERELKKSEQRYTALFNEMPIGLAVYDVVYDNNRPIDYRFVDINNAYEKITGLKTNDIIGKTILEATPAFKKLLFNNLNEVASHEKPIRFEKYISELDRHYEALVFSLGAGQLAIFTTDITRRKLTEIALKDSEETFSKIFHTIPVLMAVSAVNEDKLIQVNDEFLKSLEYTRDEVIGRSLKELKIFSNYDQRIKIKNELLNNDSMIFIDIMIKTKSGKIKYVLFWAFKVFIKNQESLLIVMNDITDRRTAERKIEQQYLEIQKQNEELIVSNEEHEAMNEELISTHDQLILSEVKYKTLYDNALVAIVVVNMTDYLLLEINELGFKLFGYSNREEIIGKLIISDHFKNAEEKDRIINQLLYKGEIQNVEVEFFKEDGASFWGEASFKYYPEEEKAEGIIVDITKRKEAEDKIVRLTFYDRLTELPNKGMFKNHLQAEIAKDKRSAIICLGVDKFKIINDIFGHATGDHLLKCIAVKLNEIYFKKDLVSRYESDRFMILLSDIGDSEDEIQIDNIEKIIMKTQKLFSAPVDVDGQIFEVSSSIGVAIYPTDGNDSESLMRNSEFAMNVAKKQGRNKWYFFDAGLNKEMLSRVQFEDELKLAVKDNEFIAHYQPKVNEKGEIIGLEALARWQSSKRGALVPPFEFIPIVEKNGMIVDIGYNIFKTTCEQNKKWQDAGRNPIQISVNLSPFQLGQSDLVSKIRKMIIEIGIEPKWLELEITETGIMENEEESIIKLKEIHDLGISISIDDFGTGYSSLSKLKLYPIDILKIDKSFVDDLPFDKLSSTITKTIIELAHNLGFKVVAEGVETKEQLDFLKKYNCDYFQGYYFYKPMPPEDIEKII